MLRLRAVKCCVELTQDVWQHLRRRKIWAMQTTHIWLWQDHSTPAHGSCEFPGNSKCSSNLYCRSGAPVAAAAQVRLRSLWSVFCSGWRFAITSQDDREG